MAHDTTLPVNVPVVPRENPARIAVVASRWSMVKTQDGGHQLYKVYALRTLKQRNAFVKGLMSYEESTGHMAWLTVHDRTVTITVNTPGIDSVTELDKEYGKFADTHYQDVSYNVRDEDE